MHYNWHRHYDASIGRYTQPDPLGFVDGPSVYGYAVGSPQMAVDPEGRAIPAIVLRIIISAAASAGANAGWQLWKNGGRPACVDWRNVAAAAGAGASFGGASKISRSTWGRFWRDQSGAGKDLKQVTDAFKEIAKEMGRRPSKQDRKDFGKYVEKEKAGGPDFSWNELIEIARMWFRGDR